MLYVNSEGSDQYICAGLIRAYIIHIHNHKAWLYSAVSSWSDFRSRGCKFESLFGNINFMETVMKLFLQLFCPLPLFKKDSFHLLAKECAQVLVNHLED